MYGENYKKVLESMNKSDQKDFNFDPTTINWKNYFDSYHFGVRKFIFDDKSVGSVAAQRKVARLKYMNYILSGSIVAFSLIAVTKLGNKIIRKNEENENVSSFK
ncbi:hypothetical protein ACKWTF_001071 [Chironomus riparius]